MIDLLVKAADADVSRETYARLQEYVRLLQHEALVQNLIAPSTLNDVWTRHIADSAQLMRYEPRVGSSWADVGSGAGLPGLVVGILASGPMTLIEPRRLRAEFLKTAVAELDLADRITVTHCKVERVEGQFDVITGRAVAALDGFLQIASHLSSFETTWVLPKGKGAQSELAQARRNWHCDVRVEQSCTDPESQILVLTRVGAKKSR